MIRINLLPYRAARTKENIRKQVSIFILSLILLIVVLIGYHLHLKAKTHRLANQLEAIKKELVVYEEKAKQVEGFKQRLAMLEKQIEIVKQLKMKREEPPKLLSKMTDVVVPGRMQMTNFSAGKDTVSISGVALDNETVALFMTRLERSDLFSAVNLASSKQVQSMGIPMKEFKIDCAKKPASGPAAPPEAVKTAGAGK